MFLLSLWSLAFASETCGDPFAQSGSWNVASETLRLDRGVLSIEGAVLAEQVLELDVVGDRAVFVMRSGPRRDLVAYQDGSLRTLVANRSPALPKLSDDGQNVAFVDGATSISSVYLIAFDGGEPRQLTNVGLVRTPGRAPAGFVPSPSTGKLRFEGAELAWEDRDTTHRVRWNGGDR